MILFLLFLGLIFFLTYLAIKTHNWIDNQAKKYGPDS